MGHLVDDSGIAREDGGGPFRLVANDGVLGVGKILDNVDAGLLEESHALLVVLSGVNRVDADNVGAELSQQWHIASAAGLISQRVGEIDRGGRGAVGGCLLLVCDTLDEEFGAVRLVEEVGALGYVRGSSMRGWGRH